MEDKEKDKNKKDDPEVVDLGDNYITEGADESKIKTKKIKDNN